MAPLMLDDVIKLAPTRSKTAFVFGKFNVLHPGHIRLFRFAREISDFLIVGVYEDGFVEGILLPECDRLEAVATNSWVNAAFIMRTPSVDVIAKLKPRIVVKGKEYEEVYNPELEAVSKYNGSIRFASGDSRFSSIELLRAEVTSLPLNIDHYYEFLSRRDISLIRLNSIISEMAKLHTLVIGDIIVDEYVDCEPVGLSSEDPTVVVRPLLTQKFLGGAAIVASHAASLCGKTTFVSIAGNDSTGEFAKSVLDKYHVCSSVMNDPSRPTTTKRRFRANGKTLLRVNEFRDHEIEGEVHKRVIEVATKEASNVDLIIFSDFSYGLLCESVINSVTEVGKARNITMAGDSQTSSQMGDIARFHGLSLLTPTEKEARLATKDRYGGLVVVAETLKSLTNSENVVLTLGTEGVIIHAATSKAGWDDDRIPALNKAPKDISGAGDAFLTVTALAITVGATIWEASYLGSMAAACQVSRIGNVPLKRQELFKESEN